MKQMMKKHKILEIKGLHEMENQGPKRGDNKKDNAKGVRYSMALCEGISESTRCPDVLLKQVTTNEEAD